jgi:hypothetical protein
MSYNKVIKNNFENICKTMNKYIIDNTGPDVKMGRSSMRGELNFDIFRLLENLLEIPIFGSRGGSVTYTIPEGRLNSRYLKEKTFASNEISEINLSNQNIIIYGGSINGLYLSIVLKLFLPKLNIIIITKKQYSERLTREQLIRDTNKWDRGVGQHDEGIITHLFSSFYSVKILFVKYRRFSLIPSGIKELFEMFNTGDPIEINVIEYCFANYTQSLGNFILFSEDLDSESTSLLKEKTIMYFDATGGRMPGIEYLWSDMHNKYGDEYHRKGYNSNPVNILDGKCYIAIGDSLYQGNFTEGNSVVISFCVSLVMAITLSKILYNTSRHGGKKKKTRYMNVSTYKAKKKASRRRI